MATARWGTWEGISSLSLHANPATDLQRKGRHTKWQHLCLFHPSASQLQPVCPPPPSYVHVFRLHICSMCQLPVPSRLSRMCWPSQSTALHTKAFLERDCVTVLYCTSLLRLHTPSVYIHAYACLPACLSEFLPWVGERAYGSSKDVRCSFKTTGLNLLQENTNCNSNATWLPCYSQVDLNWLPTHIPKYCFKVKHASVQCGWLPWVKLLSP